MGKIKDLKMIEEDFEKALEALSSCECRFNSRLLSKTRKVSALLKKIPQEAMDGSAVTAMESLYAKK